MVYPTSELSVPYVTLGETYAASIVLPVLSIVFVLLRVYTRRLQKNPLGIDDWLMLPALAMVIAMGITLIIGIQLKAIAYPTPSDGDLTPEEQWTYVNPTMSRMTIIQYAFLYLLLLAFGFVKLSIIFLYRRLFVTGRGTLFDWATKISISVVILWTISFFFGFMFVCGTHFSAAWGSLADATRYCPAAMGINNPFAVSDLITDFLILCLPLPVIWNLHMTTARKFMVTGILATGAISVVAAIIKVIISFEISNAGLNIQVDPDLTVTTILYWCMIEAGLAIIAACLPNLRYLLSKRSLNSVFNSVRSALSLRSLHSQSSGRFISHSEGSYTNIVPGNSSASEMPMVKVTGSTGSSRAGEKDAAQVTESGIYVTSQISQHESMV